MLASADSLAWSYGGRGRSSAARKAHRKNLRVKSLFGDEPTPPGKTEANELAAALRWRAEVLDLLA